jgi:transketolase
MHDRWRSFGWQALEVDGHDADALAHILSAPPHNDQPRVVVARTVLGKGVSFMEDRLAWHYLNLTDDTCRAALAELEAAA